MQAESFAFGPPRKERWVKRHRVVTFIVAFVLTASTGAFAAWVTGILTAQQQSGGRVVSTGTLSGITTTQVTNADVATNCGPPNGSPATPCDLYFRVNNGSGIVAKIVALTWDRTATASVTGAAGSCPGTLTNAADAGPGTNFLVPGTRNNNLITDDRSGAPITVPQGTNLVVVQNAWGVNNLGDQSGCASGQVAFSNAAFTVTFSA